MLNPYQVAMRTLIRNPHIGRMALDDPECVTLTFPDGQRYTAVPLQANATEFDQFGNIITQEYTKVIVVSTDEVPLQPPKDTLVEGYQQRWYVNTAERSDTETSWRLDLFVEQ